MAISIDGGEKTEIDSYSGNRIGQCQIGEKALIADISGDIGSRVYLDSIVLGQNQLITLRIIWRTAI